MDDGYDDDATGDTADDINPRNRFLPIRITVSKTCPIESLSFGLQYPTNQVRLWLKDGMYRRRLSPVGTNVTAGSIIPCGQQPLWNMGSRGAYTWIVYAEGIQTGAVTVALQDAFWYQTGVGWTEFGSGPSASADLKILDMALVPNYDRDSDIDDADRAKAKAGERFYFWVNDDDDSGFEDDTLKGKMDIPGARKGLREVDRRTPDHSDTNIDGERDWVDFFPVFLDIKPTLDVLGTSAYKYVLKHAAGAVNAYIQTDLGPADADKHLRDYTYAHGHTSASLERITAAGCQLPVLFLDAVKNDGKGVILLEASTVATNRCLDLEVRKLDDTVVFIETLPLSLDGVERMFLHKNLRAAGGGSGGEPDRTSAPNYPDSLCNGKQFVFIHGYNVNAKQARGWEAETFKRMYWSRNNARFHAITWTGDESQWFGSYVWPSWGYICPDFHTNVVSAWKTAPAVRDYIAGITGEVYLAAHSLGNMVAANALMLDTGLVKTCFMLDAAIASEAFDPAAWNENMLHRGWLLYEPLTNLYASSWHLLFGPGDKRADLTWQGRFDSIASKCFNLYSSGDQVFDEHPKTIAPSAFHVMPHVSSGRYSWAFQEKRKGSDFSPGGDDYTFSRYAGWSFNDRDPPDGWTEENPSYDPMEPSSKRYIMIDPTEAATIAPAQLVTKPFFGMGSGEFRSNLFTTNTATANAWLTETNVWRVIAGTIPARSLAAGRDKMDRYVAGNADVNDLPIKPLWWPDRGGDVWKRRNWLHSDIRNMAYLYTHLAFDRIVAEGGLE